MGLCLNAIGSPYEAIDAHAKAIQIDADFKEAWTNMAQAYKDLGVHDKAEQLFTKVKLFSVITLFNAFHLVFIT
jgi:Tfp pilus assembly protein PilF